MKNSTKSILWKIYFWITLLNFFTYLCLGFSRFWEIVDFIIFAVALIGLFAFIWEKIIFPRLFWKINFFTHILWNMFYLYFLPFPEQIKEITEASQFTISTTSVIYYIPLFYGLYFYAFKFNQEIQK